MKKKTVFRLLLVGIAVVVFVFVLRRVGVGKLECSTQLGECSEELRGIVEKHMGSSYFEVKSSLIGELAASPRVEHFSIRFSLPDVLILEIVEREPVMAAKFGENNYFVFDKDGVGVGVVTQTQLPVVTVYEVPASSRFSFAMKLARDLVKYYGAGEIRLDKFGLYARVRRVDVVFPLEGDTDVLLGALEVSLSQLNEATQDSTIVLAAGKSYKVDLRYKNPVVGQL